MIDGLSTYSRKVRSLLFIPATPTCICTEDRLSYVPVYMDQSVIGNEFEKTKRTGLWTYLLNFLYTENGWLQYVHYRYSILFYSKGKDQDMLVNERQQLR